LFPYRNFGVHVEAEKEGDGVSLDTHCVADAVDSGHELVVGDSLQEVADVDDKRPTNGLCLDINPVLVEHFEASYHVLVQDGEGCLPNNQYHITRWVLLVERPDCLLSKSL